MTFYWPCSPPPPAPRVVACCRRRLRRPSFPISLLTHSLSSSLLPCRHPPTAIPPACASSLSSLCPSPSILSSASRLPSDPHQPELCLRCLCPCLSIFFFFFHHRGIDRFLLVRHRGDAPEPRRLRSIAPLIESFRSWDSRLALFAPNPPLEEMFRRC